MKRYDAWSEPGEQRGYGGARCELQERVLGQYVTFEDHCKVVAELQAEIAAVKAQSLRIIVLDEPPNDYEYIPYFYMTPTGIGWHSTNRHEACVETPDGYHDFSYCKKIRLEQWENEG